MSRNFFVKFNLDTMRADLEDASPEFQLAWFQGFRRGVKGKEPAAADEAGRLGEVFGYHAWQEANKFRASRAANRAQGWDKKKRAEEQPTSNIQHPAASVVEHMNNTCSTRVSEKGEDASGDAPQTPASSRNPYLKCDAKFAKPESVLSFEQTPAGIAALAKRAEIKARLAAKKVQHVS
jgi:hypothetical protein